MKLSSTDAKIYLGWSTTGWGVYEHKIRNQESKSNVIYGWQIQKRMYYLFLYYTTMTNLPFERFESTQGNRFYFNLMLQDENKIADPHFKYKNKDTGEVKQVRKLQGNIVSIIFKDRERELNGKTKISRNISITLQDKDKPENFYIIRWDFTSVMRNILNALASQERLGFVSLSLYINKWWYASVWVYGQSDMMSWKLSLDEQKKLMRDVIDPETKEKLKTDYSKLDAELEKIISSIPVSEEKEYEVEDELSIENDEVFAEETPIVDSMRSGKDDDNEDLPF